MRLGVEAALVGGKLLSGDVEIADGRISAVGLDGRSGKGIAAPGFVDLQVNGWGDVDFATAEVGDVVAALDALTELGTTGVLLTLCTARLDAYDAAL